MKTISRLDYTSCVITFALFHGLYNILGLVIQVSGMTAGITVGWITSHPYLSHFVSNSSNHLLDIFSGLIINLIIGALYGLFFALTYNVLLSRLLSLPLLKAETAKSTAAQQAKG